MAKIKTWKVKPEYVGKVRIEDGAGNVTVLSDDLTADVLAKLALSEHTRFFLEKKNVEADEQIKEN